MSFFNQIIKKLFGDNTANASGYQQPIIQESFERKAAEIEAYEQWLSKQKHLPILQSVEEAYQLKKVNKAGEINLHIHNSPYGNGFFFTYHHTFTSRDFQFIFDYFRDAVKEMGYRLYVSDRRILNKEDYIETIEKHYLKPAIDADSDISQGINQLYGNILLEHVLINDSPSYIKVMANIYSDALYQNALDFEDFVARLLKG